MTVSLFFCLFIYVFYRTEKTLVNQLIISVFSKPTYLSLKATVNWLLTLPDCFIYSLPEGLWVFVITVSSSAFHLELGGRKWSLVFVPIGVALLMEFSQLVHLTNGHFDWMDLIFSTVFWLLAVLLTGIRPGKESIFSSFNTQTVFCMISYFIVYLAHVTY